MTREKPEGGTEIVGKCHPHENTPETLQLHCPLLWDIVKIIQRIWLTLITFLKIMAFCFLLSVSCLSVSIPKALGLRNLFLQRGSWDVASHAASQCSCDSHNLETVHRGRTQNSRRVQCLCFCEGERFYQEISIGTVLIITQAMHSDIFIILLGDARPYVMLLSLSYAVNSSMQY